jgi:hypothetical protein
MVLVQHFTLFSMHRPHPRFTAGSGMLIVWTLAVPVAAFKAQQNKLELDVLNVKKSEVNKAASRVC